MTPRPPSRRPTDAELAILRVLWRNGPLTVRAVAAELEKRQRTGYTTALKLLQIMTEKGLVERDESERAHVYRAKVTEDQAQRRLVRELLDKAFEGSAAKLVQKALSAKRASPAEIQEIRRLLADYEESRGGSA